MKSVRSFALVFSVVSAAVLAPAPPAIAICPTTTGAASRMWDMRPTGCQTTAEAEKICKQWLKLCRKRVQSAFQCNAAQYKTEAAVTKAVCGQESEPNPKGCKQNATANKKALTDAVKQTKEPALSDCKNRLPTCISDC